ncbi:MAG: type II toxin-antitoxin system RelE/ParE family toxin [Pseudomonadota bacterium]
MAGVKPNWTPTAQADLVRLQAFLQDKNAAAAIKAATAILNAVNRIAQFPAIGQRLDGAPDFRTTYARFGQGSYTIRYQLLDDGSITITRIWHSREDR